jgi:hypothetical protein
LGIAVDRKHAAKCLFPQEKGTLHTAQKVYIYSQNALKCRIAIFRPRAIPNSDSKSFILSKIAHSQFFLSPRFREKAQIEPNL